MRVGQDGCEYANADRAGEIQHHSAASFEEARHEAAVARLAPA